MAFTPKEWKDSPDTSTPISAAALENAEKRVTDYVDSIAAGRQPSSATLTALAALTTNAYGRELLELASASAARTKLGLGTAATKAEGAFQTANEQLTAIAALTTTEVGRALLTKGTKQELREYLEVAKGPTEGKEEGEAAGATLLRDMSSEDGSKSWANIQQAAPKEFSGTISNTGEAGERVKVETSPLPSGYTGTHTIRFEYQQGDPQTAAAERAELQPKSPSFFAGDEFWAVGYYRVEEHENGHYALIRQWHEDSEKGSAPGVGVGIYWESEKLIIEPNTGVSWCEISGLSKKQYYRYKLHIKVSETAGVVEFWHAKAGEALEKKTLKNGLKSYTNANTLNAKTPGVGEEIYEKLGVNRSEQVSGTTKVYHAGAKVYSGSVDPGE